MKTYTFTNIFDKKSYTVAASDDNKLFCLQDNEAAAGAKCKYWIKVKEDHEFTYKIQKTQENWYFNSLTNKKHTH